MPLERLSAEITKISEVKRRENCSAPESLHAPKKQQQQQGWDCGQAGGHVAPHHRGDIPRANFFPANQRDLGRLDHRVRGLNHRDQSAGLDHAECFAHASSSRAGRREMPASAPSAKPIVPKSAATSRAKNHRSARSLRTASSINASSSSRVTEMRSGPLAALPALSLVTKEPGLTAAAVVMPYCARAVSNFSTSRPESKTCLPSRSVARETCAKCSTVSMRKNAVSKSAPLVTTP